MRALFFVCGCIKGVIHKTMKNTRGEREGGRQPRPRKLPIGARGDIQIQTYPPRRPIWAEI